MARLAIGPRELTWSRLLDAGIRIRCSDKDAPNRLGSAAGTSARIDRFHSSKLRVWLRLRINLGHVQMTAVQPTLVAVLSRLFLVVDVAAVLEHVAAPRPAFLDDRCASQASPSIALFGLDRLCETYKAVDTVARNGLVGVGDVGQRRARDATVGS